MSTFVKLYRGNLSRIGLLKPGDDVAGSRSLVARPRLIDSKLCSRALLGTRFGNFLHDGGFSGHMCGFGER